MSYRSDSSRLVARLRANRLIPPAVPCRIARVNSGGISWKALHAVTGQELRVASPVAVGKLVAAPHWDAGTAADGTVLLTPGDGPARGSPLC